jgi:hypothetical protein
MGQPGKNLVSGSRVLGCTFGKLMLSKCTFGNVMVDRRRKSRNAWRGESNTSEVASGKIMPKARQDIRLSNRPVRHWKFTSKKRTASQLSTKILDRVSQASTREEASA